MPKATSDWNEDLQGKQSNANCVKLTRDTYTVAYFKHWHYAEEYIRLMQNQWDTAKESEWKIEPWFIEGEF